MKSNQNENPLSSPCIRNCCLDADDICLGCFRSLTEITGWNQADAKTRRRFLDNAESRKKAHKNKALL
ncbi:MAG: DUF1289 domain-containing protein [Methylococcales bacterium]|nr:DUF1289 domain-containing protein [Methylococcales bacterium]